MKVSDLINTEHFSLVTEGVNCDREICGGYTSDLLSDVMGNSDEGMVWITIQTHKNIVAIASLKELACVIIANGNRPSQDLKDAAINEDIPILSTSMSSFDCSGIIHQMLNQ